MHSLDLRHDHLLLDTCCIINIYQTGYMREILRSLAITVVVLEDVFKEVKTSDLDPYIEEGVVVLEDLVGNEFNIMTRIAADIGLDNGESAVGAAAISRLWAMATDDRQARNYFQQHFSKIQLISTPEILGHWANTTSPPSDALRTALHNIEQHGNFKPGSQHRYYQWWRSACDY